MSLHKSLLKSKIKPLSGIPLPRTNTSLHASLDLDSLKFYDNLPPNSHLEEPSESLKFPSWESYFENIYKISISEETFAVYSNGTQLESPSCCILLLHGAGHSSLSWAHCSKRLGSVARVFAIDWRGHGNTECKHSEISKNQLIDDFCNILKSPTIQSLLSKNFKATKTTKTTENETSSPPEEADENSICDFLAGPPPEEILLLKQGKSPKSQLKTQRPKSSTANQHASDSQFPSSSINGGKKMHIHPKVLASLTNNPNQPHANQLLLPIVIVGHSMGGALSAHLSQHIISQNQLLNSPFPTVAGMVIVDVVEGTAIQALPMMTSIIRKRPTLFNSLSQAVSWAVDTGIIHNFDSATLSIPSQLRPIYSQIQTSSQYENSSTDQSFMLKYTWKIDLSKTMPFWRDWFLGLSTIILKIPIPKLVLLAGTDRLDRELIIGHMQGKFQLVVLPRCGHIIQEDDPEGTVRAIQQFTSRYSLTAPYQESDNNYSFP